MDKPKPMKVIDYIYATDYLEKRYKSYKSGIFGEWIKDRYDYLLGQNVILNLSNDDYENNPSDIREMLHIWFSEFCDGYQGDADSYDKSYEIKIRYWW